MDHLHRTVFFRKPFFPIILYLLFTLLVPFEAEREVHAQTQNAITITARAGLNGFCKVDKWLPVHVTVENTGADINARVQTSYKNSGSGQTTDGTDISLPSTSRKEFFLYIKPEGFMRTFNVSVLDGSKVLAKTTLNINCTGDTTTLFGVLADNPSNFTVLNNVRPLTGVSKTTQLKIADLPDNPLGWSMLDVLVISNVDTGTLSSSQKQALELWLANGGKLFVTGGIQWQLTTAGLSDFLPIKLTSIQKVNSLSALAAYTMDETPLESETILAAGAAETGTNILVSQNGIPVLIEKQIGYGKVYFFAADPGLRPLNDWPGMETLYEHLLAFKSPKPTWADGPWNSYPASTALATLPELSLPSFIYICGWLGLYITIIGPVNYFILRRMKRTELAWITVPVLVIIFTSLAYFSGYLYRGTRPIMNRLMLAQAWQGVDQAQATAIVGLYSPSRTAYTVESQDQFLIFPYPDMNENLQGNNDWLSLKNDKGITLPKVRVDIGGMQSMGLEGSLPSLAIQHDLALTLTDQTPVLAGSITNTSKYTLKDVTLVTHSSWRVLGDFAPNESKDISITLVNNSSNTFTNQYAITSSLGLNTYADDIEEQRRAWFFESITSSSNGMVNVNTGVYLMAWVEDEISIPINLQDQEVTVSDTLLYFEKLNPALKTEAGALMLTSSIYSWESSIDDSITTSNYNFPSDGYIIRFQPSLPVHFSKVDSLKFNIALTNTPDKVQVSLWNFETKTWNLIKLNTLETYIPEAWQYIGMDGKILMNIKGNQVDYFEITAIDFILMVQP